LYVRKCKVPDVVDATGKLLLALPEWSQDFADKPYAWVEVLGKGPDVGKPAIGDYGKIRTKRGYARHIPDKLTIGCLVLIPAQPWLFWHSPYAPKGIELFIDETVPLAIYTPDTEVAA